MDGMNPYTTLCKSLQADLIVLRIDTTPSENCMRLLTGEPD